jgi:mRNA-degrading endonuclease RelE of RelBE toxin-antitoxin system
LKIVLLPQAQKDLDTIRDPLLARIAKRLRLLERFPSLGAPMMGAFHGYRSTVVGMFRIIYQVRRRHLPRNTIEVAYIRDCRRAPLA